jgi:hypothetical protein
VVLGKSCQDFLWKRYPKELLWRTHCWSDKSELSIHTPIACRNSTRRQFALHGQSHLL